MAERYTRWSQKPLVHKAMWVRLPPSALMAPSVLNQPKMNQKIVIGLVGEKGSGKETFGNLLQEILLDQKIYRIRFSDILVDTLKIWDIPKTRENLQKLAVVMKNGFGEERLPHAVETRINQSDADIVLIDGIRWMADVNFLKSFDKNLLVYITANLKIRYERLKNRSEKVYEEATTFEQFMKEEQAENELLIPKIGSGADYKIINNGTFEQFKKEVRAFREERLKPILSPQTSSPPSLTP